MKIVIVGASSLIAEHCARLWVQTRAIELLLIGRDVSKLNKIAADLRVRSPASTVNVLAGPMLGAAAVQDLVNQSNQGGVPNLVLLAMGCLPSQEQCQQNLVALEEALQVNAISLALYAEGFVHKMSQAKQGTLVIIGSVAGDRGRRSNYVYGSAKGLLTRYCQGLQHRLAGTAVRAILVKPGPTQTPMTAHMPQGQRMAKVEDVAAQIVAGIAKGKAVIYAPTKWALIMMVVRHLPGFIFNKLEI